MPQKVRIALDAMGGDHGPSVVVPGAAVALAQHPGASFILFGDQAKIEPLLGAHPQLREACRLVHTDVAVRMEDKPSQALRNGRWKSSMWLAIDAVKKGDADVAVSAGNTGALMAMAKFNLKMLPGIERPRRARNDHRGSVITPHGVERDADLLGHGLTLTPAVGRREFRFCKRPGENRQ